MNALDVLAAAERWVMLTLTQPVPWLDDATQVLAESDWATALKVLATAEKWATMECSEPVPWLGDAKAILAGSLGFSPVQVAHMASHTRLTAESAMLDRLSPKQRRVALALLRHGRAL